MERIAAACAWKERCEPIRTVLTWLAETYQIQAVCAGGAPRDLWHGKTPKDVDIFVFGFDKARAQSFIEQLRADLPEAEFTETQCYPGTDHPLNLQRIIEFCVPACPWPLQLIFCGKSATPEQVVARIDFGICRIGLALGHDIVTPEFVSDAEERTFTLLRVVDDFDAPRSVARFCSLRWKYPHHILNAAGYDSHGVPINPEGMTRYEAPLF